MKHLETLLEEYKGELAELEKAYHTFTDVVGNHFDAGQIARVIQVSIIGLREKINSVQEKIDDHNTQFVGEKEFDKYDKLNY